MQSAAARVAPTEAVGWWIFGPGLAAGGGRRLFGLRGPAQNSTSRLVQPASHMVQLRSERRGTMCLDFLSLLSCTMYIFQGCVAHCGYASGEWIRNCGEWIRKRRHLILAAVCNSIVHISGLDGPLWICIWNGTEKAKTDPRAVGKKRLCVCVCACVSCV